MFNVQKKVEYGIIIWTIPVSQLPRKINALQVLVFKLVPIYGFGRDEEKAQRTVSQSS